MKSMGKEQLVSLNQVGMIRQEQEIMMEVDHPFLVSAECVFQTDYKIFFIMEFVRGGELFLLLRNLRRLPEKQARFFTIQLAFALGYLHEK